MKNLKVLLGLAGVIGFVACGGDDKPGYVGSASGKQGVAGSNSQVAEGGEGGAPASGGGTLSRGGSGGSIAKPAGGTSGVGLGGEGGAAGAAGAVDPGTPPSVLLLSPDAVTDPLGGQVLVADSVAVVCQATEGVGADASPLDPKSVKVALLGPDGETVIAEKDALNTQGDEYEATVPLTDAVTGKVVLRCSARSATRALGSDAHDMLADRGPAITLTAPAANAQVALKEPLGISFTALPLPLAPTGDTQADVASVNLTINGVTVPTTAKGAGVYAATVDLNTPQFDPKPNGATAIAVSATNKRAPTAAVTQLSSSFVVDGVGPVINITAPTNAKIVGGVVTVSFTVTDVLSGVNPDSVIVSVDNQDHPFKDDPSKWTHTGNSFTFQFDSRADFPLTQIQIPIKVTADDNVGNTTPSASVPIYLDNVGPEVDLDPQNVRARVVSNGECGSSIDPLGGDAVNDLQQDGSGLEFLRAFVWDKTNEPQSVVPLHIAGVDTGSVKVFFRNPGDAIDLLINSKAPGSGLCDEIADSGVQAESINLSALQAAGSPWYAGESSEDPTGGGCLKYPKRGTDLPTHLCGTASSLWHVVTHNEYDLHEPAVYAFSPTGASECTGQAWGFESLVDADGFVCFAARATDKIGNVGVSPPLRLCVDLPTIAGVPACAVSSVTPPTCTDGCTPPARGGGWVIPLN